MNQTLEFRVQDHQSLLIAKTTKLFPAYIKLFKGFPDPAYLSMTRTDLNLTFLLIMCLYTFYVLERGKDSTKHLMSCSYSIP
jgi:hypothetical protein